jgi:hypothetical protein
MTAATAAVMVLYRWRLKPGSESQFVLDWSSVTRTLRDERHSAGSRLHRGDDGLWYGYAQWPDVETLNGAFTMPLAGPEAARMRDAIVEDFAPVRLTPLADFLVPLA